MDANVSDYLDSNGSHPSEVRIPKFRLGRQFRHHNVTMYRHTFSAGLWLVIYEIMRETKSIWSFGLPKAERKGKQLKSISLMASEKALMNRQEKRLAVKMIWQVNWCTSSIAGLSSGSTVSRNFTRPTFWGLLRFIYKIYKVYSTNQLKGRPHWWAFTAFTAFIGPQSAGTSESAGRYTYTIYEQRSKDSKAANLFGHIFEMINVRFDTSKRNVFFFVTKTLPHYYRNYALIEKL